MLITMLYKITQKLSKEELGDPLFFEFVHASQRLYFDFVLPGNLLMNVSEHM
jgi:hypothetical protein